MPFTVLQSAQHKDRHSACPSQCRRVHRMRSLLVSRTAQADTAIRPRPSRILRAAELCASRGAAAGLRRRCGTPGTIWDFTACYTLQGFGNFSHLQWMVALGLCVLKPKCS